MPGDVVSSWAMLLHRDLEELGKGQNCVTVGLKSLDLLESYKQVSGACLYPLL